ncbi:SDR family oxidoreductase [Companilactobacillus nuruki]|uniref:Oxidoreductase n=1 Tax=Companilactobacillus nuruki TaxID=1993540 RepID=A0A2N7AVL7_9LACO|nr:SDR family NAD(P)-dependent oxidoreductase [Companilactobacillus nuruki]PMD72214.1 oxidoreductase [Companilactobacillus nuruki]
MKLINNTILITGGTSGIGLGLAEEMANRDNQIIVVGRNQDKLNSVKRKHPKFGIYQADVSNIADIEKLSMKVKTDFPQLNMLINSAGIMSPFDLLDPAVSVDSLISDIQVDLIGTVAVDKLFLPQLKEQEESMIVNISSGLANISSAAHPTYSASKAGVHMFTSALRDQLRYAGVDNIHIMELVPPLVSETNLEPGSNSISGNGDMKLVDLIKETIDGMENNEMRVNAGAAAALRKAGQTNPDNTEWDMAKMMLPEYFPNGLY